MSGLFQVFLRHVESDLVSCWRSKGVGVAFVSFYLSYDVGAGCILLLQIFRVFQERDSRWLYVVLGQTKRMAAECGASSFLYTVRVTNDTAIKQDVELYVRIEFRLGSVDLVSP